jgi:pimeloyl-ACP methyl ester carboxylesterase
MRNRLRIGCWVFLLLAGSDSIYAGAQAPFALEPCTPVKNQPTLQCAKLVVPENWDKPTGRNFALNIVVIPAAGPITQPPLYDFPGGPGIAETGGADFWLTAGSMYRAHRDIVLIDQRGTGGSHPLNCALPFADLSRGTMPTDAVEQCRAKLSEDADLSQYSTDAAVRDVEAVRAALHHERIDVSGLSYGTRYAQAYALDHPERVHAMALLGTVPPDMRLPQEFADDAQRVVNRLLDECAHDAACNKAFPLLRREWNALTRRVRGTTAQLGGRTINPGGFWEAFRGRLVTTDNQRQVPWLIHALAGSRPEPALALLHSDDSPSFANGLFLSVECPEDTLHLSAAELQHNGAHTFLGNYRVQQQYAACKTWGVPARESAYRKTKSLPVPTLFVVGEMDYVTPPEATARARRGWPNSQVIRIPDLGHFPSGLDHMECMDQIIAAFFEAGTAKGLDTSCLRTMHAPGFYTGADAPPTPAAP